jgi:hypothetical protein
VGGLSPKLADQCQRFSRKVGRGFRKLVCKLRILCRDRSSCRCVIANHQKQR